eukprot:gene16454-16633_t
MNGVVRFVSSIFRQFLVDLARTHLPQVKFAWRARKTGTPNGYIRNSRCPQTHPGRDTSSPIGEGISPPASLRTEGHYRLVRIAVLDSFATPPLCVKGIRRPKPKSGRNNTEVIVGATRSAPDNTASYGHWDATFNPEA